MGTWNAFYVKRTDEEAILATRAEFPDGEIDADGTFMGVHLSDDEYEAPENILSALSAKLKTDVYWMSFQSVVDAFQFHHWKDGKHLRALVYGCFQEERTWERVEGTPEPWERDLFFSETELQRSLKWANDDEERRKLERIWKEAKVEPGMTETWLDSRDCAYKIARIYGFPHYGE